VSIPVAINLAPSTLLFASDIEIPGTGYLFNMMITSLPDDSGQVDIVVRLTIHTKRNRILLDFVRRFPAYYLRWIDEDDI
jgi:hypothetical protein